VTEDGVVAVHPARRRVRLGTLVAGLVSGALLVFGVVAVAGGSWGSLFLVGLGLFGLVTMYKARQAAGTGKPAMYLSREAIEVDGLVIPWHELKSAKTRFELGYPSGRGRLLVLELANESFEPPRSDREFVGDLVQGTALLNGGRLEIPIGTLELGRKELLRLIGDRSGGTVAVSP
jgi:hypothetical protein